MEKERFRHLNYTNTLFRMMKCYLSLFLSMASLLANAQYIYISGRVTDECGNPIARANVRSLKSKAFAFADSNGYYRINTPYRNDTFLCSDINFQSVREPLEGNDRINFLLHKSTGEPYRMVLHRPAGYGRTAMDSREQAVKDSVMISNWEGYGGDYFTPVVIPARLVGGSLNFLAKEIIYPPADSMKRIYGVIRLGLLLDKNGCINTVTLIKGIQAVFDQAVINALYRQPLPLYMPAQQNGRRVAYYTEIEIALPED
jgi:hypothetical protein